MLLLVLGLALWSGAHLFKRLAPSARAGMGAGGKGVIAGALIISVALMVWGYRTADFIPLWEPPRFLTHLNNLLMLVALYLFAADGFRARAALAMKNPQLSAFKAWAVAHLLVNGDLASILLFGGLLAWAVVTVIVLKRSGVSPAKRLWGGKRAEISAVVATLAALGLIGWIHTSLGHWPFG